MGVPFPSTAGQISTKQMSRGSDERVKDTLLWRDDYENTTPRAIGVTASTAEVSHDQGTEGTVAPYEGDKMLKVQDADATTNQVYYMLGKLKDGKVAIDVRWFKNSDTADMIVQLEHYTGAVLRTYKIQFLESGMKWRYWNAAGAYADITGASESIADNTWNHVRVVIDVSSAAAGASYSRLATNGLDINLSALSIAAQTGASATEGQSKFTVGITAGANNKACYLDDFRVYTNVEGE